ncbi:TetR/AcrR family transcriptional regulator [Mycolicibacterium sp. CR10]|uniref:TetR/AcrR family transcriptional regulator n=1 Tax=Mycolicibacterium sp. CR10 TaxID=2562314 RepID=UPI0010C010C8|nr:TetR/AcrR family transcriptional regulator [Mycolicibacterium sp. CR10]
MRMSRQEKDRSHQRILDSAARLIRERGVDGAGVAEVMKDAGLTAGGFYRHFASKEALVAAAVDAAFEQSLDRIGTHDDPAQAAEAVAEWQRFYLSDVHVDNRGYGCPIPALAGEVGRSPALAAPMTAGVEATIERVAAGLNGSAAQRRAEAAARVAMMAGAVMIARSSDPETGQYVLDSVRDRLGINDPAPPGRTAAVRGEKS